MSEPLVNVDLLIRPRKDVGLVRSSALSKPRPMGALLPPVGEVRRFIPATDTDEWLLGRLVQRWPLIAEAAWRSKLMTFANNNEAFLVTNDRCVILMLVFGNHPITNAPVVMEVFAVSRDAHYNKIDDAWVLGADDQVPLAALYRAARDWMRGMNGARMIAGTCSDMAPSGVKNVLKGDYIVDLVNAK